MRIGKLEDLTIIIQRIIVYYIYYLFTKRFKKWIRTWNFHKKNPRNYCIRRSELNYLDLKKLFTGYKIIIILKIYVDENNWKYTV